VVIADWLADGLRAFSSVLERQEGRRLAGAEAVACAACAPGHVAAAAARARREEEQAWQAIQDLAAGRIGPEEVPEAARREHGAAFAEAKRAWAARREREKT
jgi:serine/threonine protein kinase HipA of HipAB toxin-antitoxin module